MVTPIAEEAYEALGPIAEADTSGQLREFVGALVDPLQEVEDLIRDDDEGRPGWSSILDVDRAPAKALPWLGQLVGVRPALLLDEASQRLRIRETAGFQRGTRKAIAGAARQYLTGTRAVRIIERDTSPYHFRVHTYLTETPDASDVEAALLAEKPAGLQMTYEVIVGASYQRLTESYATYNDLFLAFATYSDQQFWVPPVVEE